MKIEIVNRSGRPVPRRFLMRGLDQVAGRKISPRRFRQKTLVIAFVSESEMKHLNSTFRGKNRLTDVLSFESDEPEVLGELAICPQVISAQAKEHGLKVREEMGYMILHGFLHLLGFDHEKSEKEAKKMFSLQDAVFETLLKRVSG